MLVVAVVAVQESERVAELVRDDREQVVVAERGRRGIGELGCVERRRVDEPAVAVAVPVEDDPALGRPPGRIELGDVAVAELPGGQIGDRHPPRRGHGRAERSAPHHRCLLHEPDRCAQAGQRWSAVIARRERRLRFELALLVQAESHKFGHRAIAAFAFPSAVSGDVK